MGSDASLLLGLVQAIKGGETHLAAGFPARCLAWEQPFVLSVQLILRGSCVGPSCVKMPPYSLAMNAGSPRGRWSSAVRGSSCRLGVPV